MSHIKYAKDETSGLYEPVKIDRQQLAHKAFCGMLPVLWQASKTKLGRSHGRFSIDDAEIGIGRLSDREIEECIAVS